VPVSGPFLHPPPQTVREALTSYGFPPVSQAPLCKASRCCSPTSTDTTAPTAGPLPSATGRWKSRQAGVLGPVPGFPWLRGRDVTPVDYYDATDCHDTSCLAFEHRWITALFPGLRDSRLAHLDIPSWLSHVHEGGLSEAAPGGGLPPTQAARCGIPSVEQGNPS
jgi:hypothetical protein